QAVMRVDVVCGGVEGSALAVRGREDDEAVNVFEGPCTPCGPSLSNEFRCEPVEQFGVRRPSAVEAEVVGCVDEAHAEVVMPEAVDYNARGERVVSIGNPVGEFGPSLSVRSIGLEVEFRGDT